MRSSLKKQLFRSWKNMERYDGEWVILKNNEIIEHNKNLKVILEKAEKYNDKEIIISKNPSSKYCFYLL